MFYYLLDSLASTTTVICSAHNNNSSSISSSSSINNSFLLQRSGQQQDLMSELQSVEVQRDPVQYLKAVQRVVSRMLAGEDVSAAFTDMVMVCLLSYYSYENADY